MTTRKHAIDPITLEVVRNKLEGIANEMQMTLLHSAFSPIVKEGMDCSASLFTADAPDHRAGDRDPDPPGHHDPRAEGGHRQVSDGDDGGRRRLHPERSLLRRHAPARHHAVPAGVRRRSRRRLQRRDRPPPGRGRHGAGLDTDERDRDLPGRAAHPAAALHPRRPGRRDAGGAPALQHPLVRHVHGRPERATRRLQGRGTAAGRTVRGLRRRTRSRASSSSCWIAPRR